MREICSLDSASGSIEPTKERQRQRQLFENHLEMADAAVQRIAHLFAEEDAKQVVREALWKALDGCDFSLNNNAIQQFLYQSVENALKKYVSYNLKGNIELVDQFLESFIQRYFSQYGNTPSREEQESYLKKYRVSFSLADIEAYRHWGTTGRHRDDYLEADPSAEAIQDSMFRLLIAEVLPELMHSTLKPDELDMLQMYFGLGSYKEKGGSSFGDIAKKHGFANHPSISLRIAKTLDVLRMALDAPKPVPLETLRLLSWSRSEAAKLLADCQARSQRENPDSTFEAYLTELDIQIPWIKNNVAILRNLLREDDTLLDAASARVSNRDALATFVKKESSFMSAKDQIHILFTAYHKRFAV